MANLVAAVGIVRAQLCCNHSGYVCAEPRAAVSVVGVWLHCLSVSLPSVAVRLCAVACSARAGVAASESSWRGVGQFSDAARATRAVDVRIDSDCRTMAGAYVLDDKRTAFQLSLDDRFGAAAAVVVLCDV